MQSNLAELPRLPASWLKERARQALAPLARLATRDCARVLMYHRFGPGDADRMLSAEVLDQQLRFLRRHFNVRPLSQLIARLHAGAAPEPATVAITVDDAYADFGEHAYPVFRRHGVPVTLYVVSEFADGKFWLWWDAVRYLVAQAAGGHYRLASAGAQTDIALGDAASRNVAWSILAGIGVTLSPAERDRFLLELQHTLSVALSASPTREFAALSWDELRSLDSEIVEIGAHTRTHPILSRCDTARIANEVAGSKHDIEVRIGRQISAFCYPNGEPSDVDERCIAAVRDAGFDSAVMACGGMVRRGAHPFALERMGAPHRASEFESEVSGLSHIRRSVAAGRAPFWR